MAGAVGDRDNSSGDISFAAPTGGVTRGLMYLISGTYMVARETAAVGVNALFSYVDAVWVTKVAGTGKSLAIGAKAYYVSASKSVSPSSTGNVLLNAVVLVAAAATDTKVLLDLRGINPAAT